MLVYYLENPYGHLMGVEMGNPEARTQVKGNLFSFNMPWEDIEKCCQEATKNAASLPKATLAKLQQEFGLPHSEEKLALLVNVQIRGGSKDLTQHLSGLTMRVAIVQELINILRGTGYPGYELHGINAPEKVAQRIKEQYTNVYGHAAFIPAAIERAVDRREMSKVSIIQEKHATPAEPSQDIREWDKTIRSQHIVAERSTRSQSNVHENISQLFGKFGTTKIETGTKMVPQFHAWYLGMAFPFTIPNAVGGYDIWDAPRWRRPDTDTIPKPRARIADWLHDKHSQIGPACWVNLSDLARGLPQRIEGQFRRHWQFVPALMNLLFRERVNLGGSLSVKRKAQTQLVPDDNLETDAAMAASALYQKLESGHYIDRKNKRRKISGDFSKLMAVSR